MKLKHLFTSTFIVGGMILSIPSSTQAFSQFHAVHTGMGSMAVHERTVGLTRPETRLEGDLGGGKKAFTDKNGNTVIKNAVGCAYDPESPDSC